MFTKKEMDAMIETALDGMEAVVANERFQQIRAKACFMLYGALVEAGFGCDDAVQIVAMQGPGAGLKG